MLHRYGSVAPSGRCALAQEQLQPLWYHCYEAAVVGVAFRRLVRTAAIGATVVDAAFGCWCAALLGLQGSVERRTRTHRATPATVAPPIPGPRDKRRGWDKRDWGWMSWGG